MRNWWKNWRRDRKIKCTTKPMESRATGVLSVPQAQPIGADFPAEASARLEQQSGANPNPYNLRDAGYSYSRISDESQPEWNFNIIGNATDSLRGFEEENNRRSTGAVLSERAPEVFVANKGTTQYFALLLSVDLVEQLKTKLQISRMISAAEQLIRASEIDKAMVQHTSMQIDAELSRLRSKQGDPSQRQETDIESLRKQILKECTLKCRADRMLELVANRLEKLQEHVQTLSISNRIHETAYQDLLAQPLRESGLLVEDEELISISRALEEPHLECDQGSLFTKYSNLSDEPERSTDNPQASELLLMNIRQDLDEKGAILANIKEEFEGLDGNYYRDKVAFLEELADGEHQHDISDFDVFHARRKHEVTRQLINAEAEYDEARQCAFDAGIRHFEDDESRFQDRSDDGYSEWTGGKVEQRIHHECIGSWLDDLSESEDSASRTVLEVDEWDAESVDVSDSISARAVGRLRSKIDCWNERVMAY
ncbi:hypothetical protein EV356DRAFT_537542 [Viridothelium virens]|uniref:Uncharacterized protein n=1 Tax=Viridothelium virens TaxID=1048519 RepID=A0A6A6GUC9_VIRVR|nr:hypothetical protein EV356DRAFT_537542 [Viridothelium virens]